MSSVFIAHVPELVPVAVEGGVEWESLAYLWSVCWPSHALPTRRWALSAFARRSCPLQVFRTQEVLHFLLHTSVLGLWEICHPLPPVDRCSRYLLWRISSAWQVVNLASVVLGAAVLLRHLVGNVFRTLVRTLTALALRS